MTQTMRRALLIVALALACSFTLPPGSRSASEIEQQQSEVAAVRRVLESVIAADNARDVEAVLAQYADDAVLLPPGEAAVDGKQAIKLRYQSLFEQSNPELSFASDETVIAGEWAFDRGLTRGRLVQRAGGEPRMVKDKYLMVLRQQMNGMWRIARLMWNKAEQ